MTRRFGVPLELTADGAHWTVERAWPPRAGGGPVPLEARAGSRIRGGHWSEEAGVELLAPDADPALPSLAPLAARGAVVSHRPGRRAVVRLDEGGYAKVTAPGRAGRVLEAHARGAALGRRFRIPTVEAHPFPPGEVVRFSALGGRTLAELGADPSLPAADWAALWSTWSREWPAAVMVGSTAGMPRHDVGDEAAVIAAWAGHVAGFEVDAWARRVRATADALAAGLAALRPLPPVLAHRDLHDRQIVWSRAGGVGLLDLDTAALADPALDLGNLAAHVDLALARAAWPPDRAAVADGAIAEAAAALGVSDGRLRAWRRAAAFRVACVHRLRPRWREQAGRDIRRAVLEHERSGGRLG